MEGDGLRAEGEVLILFGLCRELRHARGQGNIHFPRSADHGQDWQPYPVDPYSAIYVMTMHIYTYIHRL